MSQTDSTLSKLNALEILYRRGYQSEVIDRAMDKLIAMERHRAQQELTDLEGRLRELEIRYKMTSEDFQARFQRGELGDDADFFEWSAFYDMRQAVRERLQNLETIPA